MQRSNSTIHIIVPVFNEERYLQGSISRLLKAFARYPSLQVYLVDDGSSDGSRAIVHSLEAQYRGRIRVLENVFGKGKGGAVRTALAKIRGGIVAIHDADLEYDPDDLAAMVDKFLLGKAEVVFGSRFLSDNHFLLTQKLQNRLLNGFVRQVSRQHLSDVACCYKVFNAQLVGDYSFRSSGFGFDFELVALLLKRANFFTELPINFSPRTIGEGKKLKPWHGLSAVLSFLYAYLLVGDTAPLSFVELPSKEA